MRIDGAGNVPSPYSATKVADVQKKDSNANVTNGVSSGERAADTYVASSKSYTDRLKENYKPDDQTIAKLKAESERRMEQLKNLVEELLLKQGQKFTESTDMFALLREGKLQVDPQTAAKAQSDIGEDGYWGVKKTSERLISFAKALTGGDPSKAQEMKNAFIKGFEEATKTWGGTLPGICHETYDATIKKFDEWVNEN